MNRAVFIIFSIHLFAACNNPVSTTDSRQQETLANSNVSAENAERQQERPVNAQMLFTLKDAEHILGEPAALSDSGSKANKEVYTYQCTYTAKSKEANSGKTGNLYCMFEEYAADSTAARVYDFIKKANEKNGIKILEGMGDEAYFHTDNENFCFVLLRKGKRIVRMKVNKVTANTSLPEFNTHTQQIADLL